jgi:hypothetical protein
MIDEWALRRDNQDEDAYCLTEECYRPLGVASSKMFLLPHRSTQGLLFPLIQCKSVAVVGPVELWATRLRRPSKAANPEGFSRRLHDR